MNLEKKLKDARDLLKIHYGYDQFRTGQFNAIKNVLEGKSTLVIMPTGGGKSLCYQLPALLLDGITIVISPLISLMKDQVDSLNSIGIPATFINSSISLDEARLRIEKVKNGHCKLLYIAPERFYNDEFMKALENVSISLFAIDEAHCISQWGHDFRPSYLRLASVLETLGKPPVIALTATATPEVKEDIGKQLNLINPEKIVTGFARPNLQFGVLKISNTMKPKIIAETVSSMLGKSGIVYVGTRKKAEEIVELLLDYNVEAAVYHAGMDGESRKWVQEKFMTGKAKVIVATNAFGMGIDKSNIRFVIHHDLPGNIEAYYQEAGRAGRDGQPSHCLLLYSSRDRYLREFFIKGDNPPPQVIKEVYEKLTSFNSDIVLITYSELSKHLSEDVPDMAIGTSIKILERNGYLSRTKEKSSNAFIRLHTNKDELLNAVGKRAKVQIRIIEKLFEKYEKNILEGWNVNIEEISEIISEKKDSIIRTLKKLEEKELAEYKPPFKGTEIHIIKRIDPDDLDLDFENLRKKMYQAYKKLDKMEEYVYSFGCRQSYILEYFGDTNNPDCKKCDICLTGKTHQKEIKKQSPYSKNIQRFSSFKPKEYNVEVDLSGMGEFNTKLTQLETLDLYKKNKSIDEIAQIRNLKPDTIIAHICFLIENGFEVDTIRLLSSEKENRIIKVAKKIGIDKLSTIKEMLGDNFSWREIKLALANAKANQAK